MRGEALKVKGRGLWTLNVRVRRRRFDPRVLPSLCVSVFTEKVTEAPPLYQPPPRAPPGEAQPQTRSRPPCDNVRSIISSRGAEIMVKSLQPDDLDIQRGRAGEWTHRRGGVA